MEFGKVERDKLDLINFTLPTEPATNAEILAAGRGKTAFYLGCASTKEKLNIYAKQFNSIELNGTFYSAPKPTQIELWNMAVPDTFKYAVKFPQVITHYKRLRDAHAETHEFVTTMKQLGPRLGGFYLMPHPSLDINRQCELQYFIVQFPKDAPLFLELRHPSWFKGGYNCEMLTFLQVQRRGTVISDAAGRRDAVHMHLATPECFIRFVGNALHETDYTRIDQWAERIKYWKEIGLQTCYFFIHQDENKDAVTLLQYLKQKLS